LPPESFDVAWDGVVDNPTEDVMAGKQRSLGGVTNLELQQQPLIGSTNFS